MSVEGFGLRFKLLRIPAFEADVDESQFLGFTPGDVRLLSTHTYISIHVSPPLYVHSIYTCMHVFLVARVVYIYTHTCICTERYVFRYTIRDACLDIHEQVAIPRALCREP